MGWKKQSTTYKLWGENELQTRFSREWIFLGFKAPHTDQEIKNLNTPTTFTIDQETVSYQILHAIFRLSGIASTNKQCWKKTVTILKLTPQ